MAGHQVLWTLVLVMIFSCVAAENTTTLTPSTIDPGTILTTESIPPSTSIVPTTLPVEEIKSTTATVDISGLHNELTAMKTALQGVTAEWEKFQGLYMKTMETKILQLFTTMTSLDTNVKALQERAHVWDIFKHHIEAWSDHMKSVDKKIDLIKRSQDTSFSMESKLTTMDGKYNQIYEKVDLVNEKMHDMLKILYQQKVQKGSCGVQDNNKDITSRLTSIEKQITMIQNNHCKGMKRNRQNNDTYFVAAPEQEPGKEFKQLLSVHKRTLNNMEFWSETVNSLNITTNRMQKNLATCCQNNELGMVHLRDSVDSAFAKLERIYLNLEVSLKHLESNHTVREAPKTATVSVEDPNARIDEDGAAGSGSGDRELELEVTTPKRPVIRKQTFRSQCHELRGNPNGIYSFGFTDDVNEHGRPFNQRYCQFDSDNSPGWTVIQRRGNFGEHRENFNRSWADYKNGFGELDKEFWFGNDFIHQLTNEDGQMMLRIEMEDFTGLKAIVHYSRFYVSSERSFYRLDVQGFDGNVADSLLYHNQMYFSTYDSANDHSGDIPCAMSHGSGWWWNNCLESNLNGKYSKEPLDTHYTGIIWEQWLGDYSLKKATMMIRPVQTDGFFVDSDEDKDDVVDSPLNPPEDP